MNNLFYAGLIAVLIYLAATMDTSPAAPQTPQAAPQPVISASGCYEQVAAAMGQTWAQLSALQRAQVALQAIEQCEPQQPPAANNTTYQQPPQPVAPALIDPVYKACEPLPGETIVGERDTKGACVVVDSTGQKFFINAIGERFALVGVR